MTMAQHKTYQPRHRVSLGQGASKSRSVDQPRRPIIRGVILVFLLTLAGGVAAKLDWQTYIDKVSAMAEKPIRHVVIEGDFIRTEKKAIQTQLSGLMQSSFVDINLVVLKHELEQNPWIDRAALSRQWPDKLSVVIYEHKPIARWGDSGFINTSGMLIQPVNTAALADLPILRGPESMHKTIVDTYLTLAQMFSIDRLALTGIYVDDSHSWRVTIDSAIELILGRGDVLTKMKNFTLVYNTELRQKKETIKRIDLRYENAMAVQWYTQTEYAVRQTSDINNNKSITTNE